jgi:hypothetical protein
MLSKLRKNLSRGISGSLDLRMHHNRRREKETISYRTNEKSRMENLRTTSLSHKKIRVMVGRRKTLGSGTSSKKSLDTTLMNVT